MTGAFSNPAQAAAAAGPAAKGLLPPSVDRATLGLLLAGLAALCLPTWWSLSQVVWTSDEQGHGPLILVVSLWLLWQRRFELAAAPPAPAPWLGGGALAAGLALYLLGRSQSILMAQVLAQLAVFVGLLLLFTGRRGLRVAAFPLLFMLFMVPWPEALVAAVTGPLKAVVSAVATELLFALDYPVGRAGVVLHVGPYMLLVADACSGLNSMFTLESLGLLYMNLMGWRSSAHKVALALLIVPIAFAANVMRVITLVLVTYHFGDEAGQGFVHNFAGMVLFLSGLILMMLTDKLLGLCLRNKAAGGQA